MIDLAVDNLLALNDLSSLDPTEFPGQTIAQRVRFLRAKIKAPAKGDRGEGATAVAAGLKRLAKFDLLRMNRLVTMKRPRAASGRGEVV
jgi:hypothetical protein